MKSQTRRMISDIILGLGLGLIIAGIVLAIA